MLGIANVLTRNGRDNSGTSTSQFMFELKHQTSDGQTLQGFQNSFS